MSVSCFSRKEGVWGRKLLPPKIQQHTRQPEMFCPLYRLYFLQSSLSTSENPLLLYMLCFCLSPVSRILGPVGDFTSESPTTSTTALVGISTISQPYLTSMPKLYEQHRCHPVKAPAVAGVPEAPGVHTRLLLICYPRRPPTTLPPRYPC